MKAYCRCLLLLSCLSAAPAYGYAPDQHQALTFIAARAVNACLEEAGSPRLTALQVRYVVRANVALADRSLFVRMFRWNYYNRADAGERSLLGVIDTRLHEHFNALVRRVNTREKQAQRYADMGRVVSYLQDVTTPSRAVPVYSNRFWRFSFSDRFDHFPVDGEAVAAAVAGRCAEVLSAAPDLDQVLAESATSTLNAVQAPILGLPATWESFWRLAEEKQDFGEYGAAGNNFGRETVFRCGQEDRCVLLESDPLYRSFAQERHVAAVVATMRALVIMQLADPAGSN